VVYVTYKLAIGHNYVKLLAHAIGLVFVGFMLTTVSSLVLHHLNYIIFHDPPSYTHLKLFQEAIAQYEAWRFVAKQTRKFPRSGHNC